MMQKACSFFGFATVALATKRHGGARIFTRGIPLREIAGVFARNGDCHEAAPFGSARLVVRFQRDVG